MPDYRLLVFDWDGTLADSIERIVVSMQVAAAACQLPVLGPQAIKEIIGLGLPEAIASLYPALTDDASIARFRRCYSEHYLGLETEPSPLFAGVVEALQAFREQGYLLAVATGKGRRGLDAVLAGHGWLNYFDVTRCADETASKPHPLMLQQILAHCRVAPEQALMVGDSPFDLLMAQRAGMHSIAVGYGAQPLTTLRQHGPQLAVETFSEIQAWLGARPCGQSIEVGEYVG